MKYFLAFLLIPTVPVFLVVIFGIGALYFALDSLLERRGRKKILGRFYLRSIRLKVPGSNFLRAH